MKHVATLGLSATAAVVTATALMFDTPVNLQPSTPGATQAGHLHISGTAITGGVQAYSPTLTGIAYGGDFRSVSNQGRGVLGNASSPTGATYGGLFQAASTGGKGIAGISSATSGTTYGGFFTTVSTTGRSVYGEAKAASGVNYGVYGKCASPTGFAGFFEGALASTGLISGNGAGLTNLDASKLASGTILDARLSPSVPLTTANNVFSARNQFTGSFVGVGPRNTNTGTGEILALSATHPEWGGFYITSPATCKPYMGMQATDHFAYSYLSTNASYIINNNGFETFVLSNGNLGLNVPTPNNMLDIKGNSAGQNGLIHIQNGGSDTIGLGRSAIVGESVGSAGGTFVGGGMFHAQADDGGTTYGLYSTAFGNGVNYGIYAQGAGGTTNYAGFFAGHLFADSSSAGVKSFLIDHPLDPANKFLEHSSMESDERMNVYRGSVTTDGSGRATIPLPNWFSALNTEIQYQLTVIDSTDSESFVLAKVVKKFDGKTFRIRTSAPNTEVNWLVSGRRHDPTSESMPLQVEREKTGSERGHYLAPQAYGKDDSFGMSPKVRHEPEEGPGAQAPVQKRGMPGLPAPRPSRTQ